MIAKNRECYKCKHNKSDWACATDYCEKNYDDRMFEETPDDYWKNPCEDFEYIKKEACK